MRKVPASCAAVRSMSSGVTASADLSPEQIEQNKVLASMEEVRKQNVDLVNHNGIWKHYPGNWKGGDDYTGPENKAELATLDMMPEWMAGNRTVVIMQEAKHAMSSGMGRTGGWTFKWKSPDAKWSNPLTGWTSSADPMVSVNLEFDTKEQAVHFAETKGLKYEIKERARRQREMGKNYYAHNFLPAAIEAKLKVEGKDTKHFNNPKANRSNYFRPLTFHGEGPCRQHGPNMHAPIAPDVKET